MVLATISPAHAGGGSARRRAEPPFGARTPSPSRRSPSGPSRRRPAGFPCRGGERGGVRPRGCGRTARGSRRAAAPRHRSALRGRRQPRRRRAASWRRCGGYRAGAERVVEAGVNGARVDQIGGAELLDAAQALHLGQSRTAVSSRRRLTSPWTGSRMSIAGMIAARRPCGTPTPATGGTNHSWKKPRAQGVFFGSGRADASEMVSAYRSCRPPSPSSEISNRL